MAQATETGKQGLLSRIPVMAWMVGAAHAVTLIAMFAVAHWRIGNLEKQVASLPELKMQVAVMEQADRDTRDRLERIERKIDQIISKSDN